MHGESRRRQPAATAPAGACSSGEEAPAHGRADGRDHASERGRGDAPTASRPATTRSSSATARRCTTPALVGKGVNRKSGLAATGTLTWKVKLSAGVLRFFSDRSPKTVKGSITVT